MAPRPYSLLQRALQLLGQREHSRAELARKLMPHATDPDEVEPLLERLQAKGLLSDARALSSLVRQRAPKLGALRLAQEARAKGLQGEALTQAVQELRATEWQRAQTVWQKKFGQPAADASALGRQMRFLAGRGFAPEVIRRVVRAQAADDMSGFEA
jgi:regulatory protein